MEKTLKISVVGAGIIGLAIAQELSQRGHEVVVIEKERNPGSGITSRNSEVIHAGIYYKPGSLKSKLCIEGRDRLESLCDKEQISAKFTGKLIVATDSHELPELEKILLRSKENCTVPLASVDLKEITKIEPEVIAISGLWSPGTGIIDAHSLVTWCLKKSQRAGALILFKHEVISASKTYSGWSLEIRQPDGTTVSIESDVVINAAGLQADAVASLVPELSGTPKHIFVKGNYFSASLPSKFKTLVYPVPNPNLVGLGTHLTIDMNGDAKLGPDVEIAKNNQDFSVADERLEQFFQAGRRFIRGLTRESLKPSYAGIRPKLSVESAEDFYIRHETARGCPGWVNLLGIESPGLTASLSIAAHVSKIL